MKAEFVWWTPWTHSEISKPLQRLGSAGRLSTIELKWSAQLFGPWTDPIQQKHNFVEIWQLSIAQISAYEDASSTSVKKWTCRCSWLGWDMRIRVFDIFGAFLFYSVTGAEWAEPSTSQCQHSPQYLNFCQPGRMVTSDYLFGESWC